MNESKNTPHLNRRDFLKIGAGAIGTATLTGWIGSDVLANPLPTKTVFIADNNIPLENEPSLTPDQALRKLMEGNQRFVEQKRINPHQNSARLTEVANAQAPFAAILACADSRVIPEIIFDQGIGDLFVVRVAGNIATLEQIGSEEYAVGLLGTPLLVVLGHERCGAVTAALETGEFPGMIESLVYAIRPAVEASRNQPGDKLTNAVKENVRIQVAKLKNSPVMAQAIDQGKLKIVGAYYDLDTGGVSLIN